MPDTPHSKRRKHYKYVVEYRPGGGYNIMEYYLTRRGRWTSIRCVDFYDARYNATKAAEDYNSRPERLTYVSPHTFAQ